MDHLDLPGRQPDPLDLKTRKRLGDGDDPRGAARQRTFNEPKRAGAERIVVVLRRDEDACTERAVDIGVHEVRVDEVCLPGRTANAPREGRIQVTRCIQPLVRNGRRRVERIRSARRIVEPQEAHVDTALAQRGQQRQQMPFRAADSADPVDVQNLHALLNRRPSSRSNTAAARSAIRKSVGTR